MNTQDTDTFGGRLRKILGVKTNAELAKKLKVGKSTITDYVNETSYPPAKTLIEIAKKANVSLDWLLLGRGEEPVSVLSFLEPAERATVEAVAEIEERTPEELIADLVGDALDARAAEMLHRRRDLRPTEIRKLKAIMRLLGTDDVVESPRQTDKRASR